MHWTASAMSDRGRVRPGNEDAFRARPDLGIFLVADGMGGHAAGEVASTVAADVVEQGVETALAAHQDGPALDAAIVDVIREADRAIRTRASREVDKAGMGTTLTVAVAAPSGEHVVVAHVGDSRAYRLRDGTLHRITTDHTWVQEQIGRGLLTPEQARSHPSASVITRALGVGGTPLQVDLHREPLRRGDVFLLCSDGLTTVLDDDEILAILTADTTWDTAAERLVEAANSRGGPDNITVVVARAKA